VFSAEVALGRSARSPGSAPTYSPRAARTRASPFETTLEQVDRLAFKHALPFLIDVEHRAGTGAERAVVQVRDVGIE
jgi:hypothetical protein